MDMSWIRTYPVVGLLALSLVSCSNIEAERRKEREQRDAAIQALPAGAAQWARSWDTYSLNGTEAGREERVRLAITLVQTPVLQKQLVGFVDVDQVKKSVTPEILDTLGKSTDGETVLLAGRWKAEVLGNMEGALPLACRASELAPNLYPAQVLCGDCFEARGNSQEAARHWQAAYPLASSREEQCAAIDRLAARSLDPDRDMKEMSATVVAKCQEEQRRIQAQEERENDHALHEKVLQAIERLESQLEQATQAVSSQPANAVSPPPGE